jgi:hypothetical protein
MHISDAMECPAPTQVYLCDMMQPLDVSADKMTVCASKKNDGMCWLLKAKEGHDGPGLPLELHDCN